MTANLLELHRVSKHYGERVAVAGTSLRVRAGESVGLLGPNGAGKTTTLSMIGSLVAPTSGEVLIGGSPIHSDTDPAKRRLGLVPQDLALLEELTARQNLQLFGALYGLRGRALESAGTEALEFVGLADRAGDRVGAFSGGMKRRLNLAAALLHDPDLLLLDEPTVGVDPQSRNSIFDNIEALRRRGKTILYTTHYLEEVERLCDRVVIMDHGRIIADEPLAALRQRFGRRTELRVEFDGEGATDWSGRVREVDGVLGTSCHGTELRIELASAEVAPAVLGRLQAGGARLAHFSTHRPTLEAVFLELTGRRLRDG